MEDDTELESFESSSEEESQSQLGPQFAETSAELRRTLETAENNLVLARAQGLDVRDPENYQALEALAARIRGMLGL